MPSRAGSRRLWIVWRDFRCWRPSQRVRWSSTRESTTLRVGLCGRGAASASSFSRMARSSSGMTTPFPWIERKRRGRHSSGFARIGKAIGPENNEGSLSAANIDTLSGDGTGGCSERSTSHGGGTLFVRSPASGPWWRDGSSDGVGRGQGQAGHVQQGSGANPSGEVPELPSTWGNGADGARNLPGGSTLGTLDQGQGVQARDAAVVHRPEYRDSAI